MGRIVPGKPYAAWVAAAALWAAALALYWSTLRHPLVFDDFLLAGALGGMGSGIDLRALSNLSFGLVQALLGADLAWQRLLNILMHGAVGAALFGFLAELFERVLGSAQARWTAFFGALAFVLHPVAVYGVAYLIQRSIIMATLFSVLSLWCALRGLSHRSWRWYAAAAALYALAVFSKEHAIMLPAVAAAMAMLVGGATRATLREFRPVFVVLCVVAAVVLYQTRSLIGVAYEQFVGDVASAPSSQAFLLSAFNQGTLFFRYLLIWLLPC